MSTAAQKAANRQNAQKSTGPTTPAGKAKCSLNRFSHGLTGALCFLENENPQEFSNLHFVLTEEFQPATPCEQILVEKMCLNQWLSLRATRLQTLALHSSLKHDAINPNLGLLIRYQQASDRAFFKARTELLTAQKERKKSEIGSESEKADAAVESTPQAPPKTPACEPLEEKLQPVMHEAAEPPAEIGAGHLKTSQKAA